MHRVKGFTLIELMIVVAVIAVLAVIALPAYQNYVVRSRISEALVLAGGLKVTVAVNASEAATDLSRGGSLVAAASDNVTSAVIDAASGTITVTTTSKAGNGVITLTPTGVGGAPLVAGALLAGNIAWACTSTIPQKFLPSTCVGV